MPASHRVKDSDGNIVGFVVNGEFYTEYYIRENIGYIENLSVTEKGAIQAEKELPEIRYKEGIVEKRKPLCTRYSAGTEHLEKGSAASGIAAGGFAPDRRLSGGGKRIYTESE